MKPGTRSHSSPSLLRARKLRREMSASEKVLGECLRKDRLGFRFKRQDGVGERYTMDFYCPEARLCVEVDGEQHALRLEQDIARDEWLGARGILTTRIASLVLFI